MFNLDLKLLERGVIALEKMADSLKALNSTAELWRQDMEKLNKELRKEPTNATDM